jgi:alpha-1,4-digalacturonate transport system substrate-binding protein
VKKSLAVAVTQVATTSPIAFRMQGYEHNRIMFNAMISRINQAINNEMTLTESYTRMQSDIVDGFAAKGIKLP